jgi:hypothetical protein
MTGKARFKSDAFEAVHSAALGLHRAGTIDKATMRGFDESCLNKWRRWGQTCGVCSLSAAQNATTSRKSPRTR